jgi:hypothetical protein
MATAAAELSVSRLWPAALLWVLAGGWAFDRLPPDGSAGLWLAGFWSVLLALRMLPWMRWGGQAPRFAGLCCPASQPRLSDVAMGWMMGTLWWHAEGCLGSAAPPVVWVGAHLLGMAALLLATPLLMAHLSVAQRRGLAGAALLLGGVIAARAATPLSLTPGLSLGVMALLSLAWACEPTTRQPPRTARLLLLAAGPLGLWLIHSRWPGTGPDALWQAIAALGLVCAFGLVLRLGHNRMQAHAHSLEGSA